MTGALRILVVKLAALGDVVMASTMLPALRERWPTAHITWLCGKGIAPLVECFEGVDEILTVDEKRLLTGTASARLPVLVSAILRLAGQRFDLCLVAHADWRYRLVPLAVRCRTVRALSGRNGPIPGRWHGDEYRRLALGEDGAFCASARLARLRADALNQKGIPDGEPAQVLLVPGGARNVMRDDNQRRWPVKYYRALAETLLAQGMPVGLVGGSADLWTEKAFIDLCVTSYIGKTGIVELLGLLSRARACVTHDTGPMHLAYLVGTPTVALFGPTLGVEKAPPFDHVRMLSATLPCAPCYDGRAYAPCPEPPCMRTLMPDTVLQTLHELLHDEKVQAD
ncbi:glycosyltransferase family 9 protein [Nitratidesulfovibrio sp. D1]|uniref:glycosyltransferase family 9 protein n=1 Tax=Nitratidesulfovibrio sp. D1 TaxID=3440151 RepID=UPI003EBC102F